MGAALQPPEAPLLARLGARIRDARRDAGLSRRALAASAQISERYLAQLESGAGNISIALLDRTARALGLDLVHLFETDALAGRIRAADADTRAGVARLIRGGAERRGRVALIGLRGAGKSTLGALAARKLGLPFHELNDEIAGAAGMSVTEVFALYGQEGYRRLEHEATERLGKGPPMILAVAGGIVAGSDTFALLLDQFRTIWLKATPEEHMARVRAQGDERPMADNPGAMADLRAILTDREGQYARADEVVDTSASTVRASLARLLAVLGNPH